MEGRGLTVENEKRERGRMESYVGTMAEGWGGDTCGCRKDGTDGGMEVGESDEGCGEDSCIRGCLRGLAKRVTNVGVGNESNE